MSKLIFIVQLRKEFDELLSINEKKTKQLALLHEQLANTENAKDLAASYSHNTGGFGLRINSSRNETRPDSSASIQFYNISHMTTDNLKKITGSRFSMNEVIKPDQLYERLKNLKDNLN